MSSRQGTLYAHDGHARPGDTLVCADCGGTPAVTQGWVDKTRRESPLVGGTVSQILQYIRPEALTPFVPAHALRHIACPECSAVGGLSTLPHQKTQAPCRRNTPPNVPSMEPIPPERLAPPITDAAIAFSSIPSPAVGCPVASQDAVRTPANAARAAQRT